MKSYHCTDSCLSSYNLLLHRFAQLKFLLFLISLEEDCLTMESKVVRDRIWCSSQLRAYIISYFEMSLLGPRRRLSCVLAPIRCRCKGSHKSEYIIDWDHLKTSEGIGLFILLNRICECSKTGIWLSPCFLASGLSSVLFLTPRVFLMPKVFFLTTVPLAWDTLPLYGDFLIKRAECELDCLSFDPAFLCSVLVSSCLPAAVFTGCLNLISGPHQETNQPFKTSEHNLTSKEMLLYECLSVKAFRKKNTLARRSNL